MREIIKVSKNNEVKKNAIDGKHCKNLLIFEQYQIFIYLTESGVIDF